MVFIIKRSYVQNPAAEDMQVEGVSKGKGEVKGENVAPVPVCFDAQPQHPRQ